MLFRRANPRLVVAVLPVAIVLLQMLICPPADPPLQRMHEIWQRLPIACGEQRMPMVGHDYEGGQEDVSVRGMVAKCRTNHRGSRSSDNLEARLLAVGREECVLAMHLAVLTQIGR